MYVASDCFQCLRGEGCWGMHDMLHICGCKATCFEAFVLPVKDFTHGVSVDILDGVSVVQMFRVGACY